MAQGMHLERHDLLNVSQAEYGLFIDHIRRLVRVSGRAHVVGLVSQMNDLQVTHSCPVTRTHPRYSLAVISPHSSTL